ncbi:hypothetical protein [Streptosporangium sp. 'caverna']|uniref:hypothetical protein n=1 Tax=Streptosporangium sp. 'caverna' TaxID=2202249 RepID=UPI0013A6D597|nr:hypothetical protein [Streptosporangium sp. 'caverna']
MKKIRVALLALMVTGALVGANAALADGTEPDPDFGVQDSHWMEPSEPPETPAPPAPSPDPSTATPVPPAPTPGPSEGVAPDPYEDWEPPQIPPKGWIPGDPSEGNP